eukprot:CAMPEP_0177597736 /NCGR_PEP_ID=MMETSP0419_2-20121207/11889_1 /TAXON_ID=582737 /ORGANISM="Tetraselmis sp., Strain GSL018" /LENGTH=282 /DNA_ID=CAMNT_0019089963 /DNA_START=791 /DNA_END=1640 /DNA_ORIENTATION=-
MGETELTGSLSADAASRDRETARNGIFDKKFQTFLDSQGHNQLGVSSGLSRGDNGETEDDIEAVDAEDGRSEHGVQGKRCSWLDPGHWHSQWSHRLDCSTEGTFVPPEMRRPGSVILGHGFEGLGTIESFNFSERVLTMCEAGDLTRATRLMPLNLPSDVSSRDFCVTQENIPGYFDLSRYAPFRERIMRQLSATLDDAFHGPTPFNSCAIVGSSGNLLKRSYGAEIDMHEKTWRFNLVRNAALQGVARHPRAVLMPLMLAQRHTSVSSTTRRLESTRSTGE